MRVGILFGGYGPEVGGGHTFEAGMMQAICDFGGNSGHEFLVLTHQPGYFRAELPAHVRVVSLCREGHKKMRVARFKRAAVKLSQRLRGVERPSGGDDWMHGILARNNVEMIWNLNPFGRVSFDIPYIAVVWDLQHRLQPFFPEVSMGGEWMRRENDYQQMLGRACRVITGTETGAKEIKFFFRVPRERIQILPYPTPSFALQPACVRDDQTLAKYKLTKGYLFYPAQFWPHKNHVGLLRALRILRDRHSLAMPLVLVGSDKRNLAYVRRVVADLRLESQVHFLGFVPQEDLVSLYRGAFAMTYVTYFGPDNLPPLEAFALGCPVVASSVAGAEEQLGDAALLVDPADPDEIAGAVKSLWDSPELCGTLRERGRVRASTWTHREFFDGMLAIFKEFEPQRSCWGNDYHPR